MTPRDYALLELKLHVQASPPEDEPRVSLAGPEAMAATIGELRAAWREQQQWIKRAQRLALEVACG